MKNLKKPNYIQKQRISKAGLDPTEFYLKEDKKDRLVIVNKSTNNEIVIVNNKPLYCEIKEK